MCLARLYEPLLTATNVAPSVTAHTVVWNPNARHPYFFMTCLSRACLVVISFYHTQAQVGTVAVVIFGLLQ